MEFEQRWRILHEARNPERASPRANHGFVYGVLTTGVYCVPGCPSRMPLRDNVRFFESSLAATQAGYRACKRCRPERARSPRLELVERACRRIEASEHLPSLSDQAREAGLSASRFHKLFKSTLGITPKQYAAAHRAGQLRRALEAGQSVTRAIHEARFSSASRVYENADALLGMAPKTYARGGQGEVIRVGIERCSLGWVLVATTERGVCAVDLGKSHRSLLASFEQRFSKAVKKPATAESRRWVRAVVREIDPGPRQAGSSLPLDLWGTAFQVRVWAKLRDIPSGKTTTYSELAQELGAPQASRAVAGACAKNPLAVLVPCHRVVRKDGGLGGYRWGLNVKRALLAREKKG